METALQRPPPACGCVRFQTEKSAHREEGDGGRPKERRGLWLPIRVVRSTPSAPVQLPLAASPLAWRRAWKAVGALLLEEQAPPDCATERDPRVRS